MLQVSMNINGVMINSIIITNKGPIVKQDPNFCRYEYEQWIHGKREVVQGYVCHDKQDTANELVLRVLDDIQERND